MKKVLSILSLILIVFLLYGCTMPYNTVVSRKITFPKDMAPHRGYPVEWWYQTGYLYEKGERSFPRFVYEFTAFRVYKPNSPNWPRLFVMPVGEVWNIHFVIHDLKTGDRRFIEDAFPPMLYVLGPTVETSRECLDMKGSGENIKFHFYGNTRNLYLDLKSGNNVEIHLKMTALKPPVLHNNGIISMIKGRSYYYSLTRIKVVGSVRFNDRYTVEGETWYDHQWGNFSARPWDWFSIRLNNDEEIMVFSFPNTNAEYGTLVKKDGTTIPLKDFNVTLKGKMLTPSGKIIPIPMPGTVTIPKIGAKFNIEAVSKVQFNNSRYTPPYWEGLCTVNGSLKGKSVRGFAFFEGWR
ncbi:MAG: hypothetical protein DRP50_02960 [Thermotoga sp.]|nr:MAG: hypothetical protein DRP50_02960 [Thermotoga sp.]